MVASPKQIGSMPSVTTMIIGRLARCALLRSMAVTRVATRSVPAASLGDEVSAVCASLATGSAQGMRESKRVLNRDLLARIDAHGEELARLSTELFGSAEAREAMAAFLARRT